MTEVLLAEIDILKKKCEKYEQAIEDIKAEIEQRCEITVNSNNEPAMTLHDIFAIIDKHISGKDEECPKLK